MIGWKCEAERNEKQGKLGRARAARRTTACEILACGPDLLENNVPEIGSAFQNPLVSAKLKVTRQRVK